MVNKLYCMACDGCRRILSIREEFKTILGGHNPDGTRRPERHYCKQCWDKKFKEK